jgi:polyisoprenyl-teichoic acid--peptidoglycan teichoic acid transferase
VDNSSRSRSSGIEVIERNESENEQDQSELINSLTGIQIELPEIEISSDPPQPSPKPQSSSPFLKGLVWGMTFTLTAAISATIGATITLMSPISSVNADSTAKTGWSWQEIWKKANPIQGWGLGPQYKITRPVNILVLGIDRVPDATANSTEIFSGRSDTILLLRFDPTNHSVKMLSIPRDTRVEDAGLTLPKMNQANADGGPTLTAQAVSKTLNNVPIDRYVRVTTNAFIELVDLVGGIEVYVPQPMHYVDHTQKLEINLEPGWQTLSGEQAEQFARFRSDHKGDIGRVQRQQALLKALEQRLRHPTILPRIPQMIRILQQYVDTNLSLEEMLALANFGRGLEKENLQMVMLPGRFSTPNEYQLSYWIMSENGRDRVMQEYFGQKPILETENSSRNNSIQSLRIAIQNATDEPNLAHKFAKYLAKNDFHNVYLVEDTSLKLRETEIVVQQGDLKSAKLLQQLLGLGKIDASSTGDLGSDLTIRIGSDWIEK